MSDDTRIRPGNWPPGPFLSHDQLTVPAPADPSDDEPEAEKKPKPVIPGPRTTSSVTKTTTPPPVDDDPGPEDEPHEEDDDKPSTPWWKRIAEKKEAEEAEGDGHDEDEAPADSEATGAVPEAPQQAPAQAPAADHESWFRALARHAGEAKRAGMYARRRIQAAKWAVGAAIGYGFNLDQYPAMAREMANADPGSVFFAGFFAGGAFLMWKALGKAQSWLQPSLGSVGEIIGSIGDVVKGFPLIGPLVNLVTGLFHAVFTNYVPFRFLVAAAGGWFAAPFGYVAVGYAQAHGVDMTASAPHLLGLAASVGAWWFIDRRTERWCVHWPGKLMHWVFHLPSGTLVLGTALYMLPS